jgi:hypothetical protein
MKAALNDLLAYCRLNGRVCPQPRKWQALYELLPERRQVGAGYVPSAPLILGGWWYSSDAAKQERLSLHIHWAAEHGVLPEVDQYLRQLTEQDWHHLGE